MTVNPIVQSGKCAFSNHRGNRLVMSEAMQALLPSEDDVAAYRERGWYISQKILSDDEIDSTVAGSEKLYRGIQDFVMPESKVPGSPLREHLNWVPERGPVLRINNYAALQNREIRDLALNPLIGAIAARLAGTGEIRLFNSTLIYKPPHGKGDLDQVGWHDDKAYWPNCSSRNMLTAGIMFHDCDEDMGPVVMLEGSHLWRDNPIIDKIRSARHFICHDIAALEHTLESSGMKLNKVPMRTQKGQVIFHHCLTLHGSGLNTTDRPRRSVIIHMQDRDNHYQPAHDDHGKSMTYNNDYICRRGPDGYPDYADPEVCPVMWRE